jgi:hypothetical protein
MLNGASWQAAGIGRATAAKGWEARKQSLLSKNLTILLYVYQKPGIMPETG